MVAFKRAMASSILWKEKASSEDDILSCVWSQCLKFCCIKNSGQRCMQLQPIFPMRGKLRETRRDKLIRSWTRGASSSPAMLNEQVQTQTSIHPLNTSCFYICDGSHASGVFESTYRFQNLSCFFINDAFAFQLQSGISSR